MNASGDRRINISAAVRLIGSLCIYFGCLGGWVGCPRDGRVGGGQGATEAIARCFFYFLRDVPRGIIGFEAISDQGEGRPGGRILVKRMILAGTVRHFGENTLKNPRLSHKIEIWAEKLAAPLWSSSDFTTKKCDFVRSGMTNVRGQIFLCSWQLRGLIQKV